MAENLNEQVGVTTPVVAVDTTTTNHGLFEFKNKDEDGKPIKEETLAHEFDQKVQVSDPVEVESKDEDEKKDGGVVVIPRSYSSSSSSSDEEGDDEETKQRKKEKKEKKGLKEKLMEKLPGHQEDVAEDNQLPIIEEPHVQEAVYSEPPHTQEDPEKKSFVDKIKEKLPGQTKTGESHDDEVVLHLAEPAVVGEEDKKQGFMDKIKDKIPGLSSSKASDI